MTNPTLWHKENLKLIENKMKMIEAHPSGSSCGASKESRTFSFWRLATESENCDFLNEPGLSKSSSWSAALTRLISSIDKHWQALISIDKHWQASARLPVNLLGSHCIEGAAHPAVCWVRLEDRRAVHLLSKLAKLLDLFEGKFLWSCQRKFFWGKQILTAWLTSTPFHLHRLIVDFWSL